MLSKQHIQNFQKEGYSIIDTMYSNDELTTIINCIKRYESNKAHIDNKNLFAIRQLIKAIPELKPYIFNNKLVDLLRHLFASDCFLTKAIYFDKPPQSNWFVSYHQDLSISVSHKADLNEYINWTYKKGQYGVQPPLNILENTITVRIHLDDTTKHNGALRVIPKTHTKGIVRADSKDWDLTNEVVCNVHSGSIMLMKPLLLHASRKTTNNQRRRVIHLEFNNTPLDQPLEWLELEIIN